jgi:hypothetical protein
MEGAYRCGAGDATFVVRGRNDRPVSPVSPVEKNNTITVE